MNKATYCRMQQISRPLCTGVIINEEILREFAKLPNIGCNIPHYSISYPDIINFACCSEISDGHGSAGIQIVRSTNRCNASNHRFCNLPKYQHAAIRPLKTQRSCCCINASNRRKALLKSQHTSILHLQTKRTCCRINASNRRKGLLKSQHGAGWLLYHDFKGCC